jgi:hypothetical protein
MSILTEREYNQIKEDAIAQLSLLHPNINIGNLIKAKWCGGIPFFYIEVPY